LCDYKRKKGKSLPFALIELANYTMELATAGVPHELVNVELGGTNLQSTAGAVPNAVYGLAVSVPPEMLAVSPAPELVVWFQVVTRVSTVEPALTAAVT
jgi:hypothetical protein